MVDAVGGGYEGTRVTYDLGGLREAGAPTTPFPLFRQWLDEAQAADLPDPTAMTVSTVAADGRPRSRTVLLRRAGVEGLDFFTNYRSDKGRELIAEPRCAAQFLWQSMHRQVRVEGVAEQLDPSDSDDYFAGRPRGSQIAAWASPQSTRLADRDELVAYVEEVTARFAGGPVPRPDFWGGFRIVPVTWEFWQGQSERLHDRLRYEWTGDSWELSRLAP